jgi:transposase InsO family protein
MIRDRDRIYGAVVRRRLRAMGIRDRPTAPASPWQNGFAERLIGSIRREMRVCVPYDGGGKRFRLHRISQKVSRGRSTSSKRLKAGQQIQQLCDKNLTLSGALSNPEADRPSARAGQAPWPFHDT